jgi:hypothetical protein
VILKEYFIETSGENTAEKKKIICYDFIRRVATIVW